jgi:hypothetical protein
MSDAPRKLDIQWAAGFFEGEGNARIHKGYLPKYNRLYLSIAQVKREPLDAFCEIVGAGTVLGPYGPYSTTRQAHYQYNVTGRPAIAVAERLIPYLLGKREQVENALSLYREVLDAKLAA